VLWNELQEVIIAVERINDVIDAEKRTCNIKLANSYHRFAAFALSKLLSDTIQKVMSTLENVSFEWPGKW